MMTQKYDFFYEKPKNFSLFTHIPSSKYSLALLFTFHSIAYVLLSADKRELLICIFVAVLPIFVLEVVIGRSCFVGEI